jgi:hypothetical protein
MSAKKIMTLVLLITCPTGSVAEFFQTNANKLCTQDMKNGEQNRKKLNFPRIN